MQKNYVEPVTTKRLIDGAITGMLASLDPHSAYLTPELYRDLEVETRGSFGGLGIEITIKNGALTVVAPIEDTPAYRAGLKAGDQVEIAVSLCDPEPPADEQFLGRLEPDETKRNGHDPPGAPVQERQDGEAPRTSSPERLKHVFARQARIDDVLDQHDVAIVHVCGEILDYPGPATSARVIGDRQEVDLAIDVDAADQVSEYEDASFLHSDQERAVRVCSFELGAEALVCRIDLDPGVHDTGLGRHPPSRSCKLRATMATLSPSPSRVRSATISAALLRASGFRCFKSGRTSCSTKPASRSEACL